MELEQSGFVSVLGKPWGELSSPEPSSMAYFWYCLGKKFKLPAWCLTGEILAVVSGNLRVLLGGSSPGCFSS